MYYDKEPGLSHAIKSNNLRVIKDNIANGIISPDQSIIDKGGREFPMLSYAIVHKKREIVNLLLMFNCKQARKIRKVFLHTR